MSVWFILLWWFVVVQRLAELVISKRNSEWMEKQGGYEVGKEHYPLIVFIHLLFFVGIWAETLLLRAKPPTWAWVPFLIFVGTQILRYWCIRSLGVYWNTKIWVVPGHQPRVVGPYRYMRHPNYVVVTIELLVFPVIFGAYLTATIVTFMHTLTLLLIRIPLEEHALREVTTYEQEMSGKRRFFPKRIEN
jgi:methyltransferase